MGFIIFGAFFFFNISIIVSLCVWIATIAKKNNGNPIGWVLLTIFSWPIGCLAAGIRFKNKLLMFVGIGVFAIIPLMIVLLVALQTYSQRTLSYRVKDAQEYLEQQQADSESMTYEPYYLNAIDHEKEIDRGVGTDLNESTE